MLKAHSNLPCLACTTLPKYYNPLASSKRKMWVGYVCRTSQAFDGCITFSRDIAIYFNAGAFSSKNGHDECCISLGGGGDPRSLPLPPVMGVVTFLAEWSGAMAGGNITVSLPVSFKKAIIGWFCLKQE